MYLIYFSRSVMSDTLRPHESQHARPSCPSPTPAVHSNSHPSSRWCHTAISTSVVPLSSCPKSLPASESFPMSQLFAWGGQSTGVSALAPLVFSKALTVYQFSSVTQLCPTLCDPMDCRMPGLPVHHQLPEFTQTQCALSWWCHPTISSSVVPFSSCLQSFPASVSFLVSSLHQVAKILEFQLQHQSFQWILRTNFL